MTEREPEEAPPMTQPPTPPGSTPSPDSPAPSPGGASPAAPGAPSPGAAHSFRWRTVDIVVASTIVVAFGVIFWGWNQLWQILDPVFAGFRPAQAFMYGVWLVPGVLGALIIRKPGAAVYTELVAAVVSSLLGSQWGLTVVLYGLLEGAAPELVFAAGRYRRFGVGTAALAAAAAGVAATVLDRIFYYPLWSVAWTGTYGALLVASSVVIAGIGGWALVKALARTGALTPFPSARA
jgi:energy-coupling factor transport system permease protein